MNHDFNAQSYDFERFFIVKFRSIGDGWLLKTIFKSA